MRLIIFICCFFIFKIALAQNAGKKYSFKEVGWVMVLPPDFKELDSTSNAALNGKGKEIIENANDVSVDMSATKTLISATKGASNYFSSTITPFDPKKDGYYNDVNQGVKEMLYKSFVTKLPGAKIDSATSITTIDGIPFDKFRITIPVGDKLILNMILLSKLYKGYDFGITYLYVDQQTKEEIESLLKDSKFTK